MINTVENFFHIHINKAINRNFKFGLYIPKSHTQRAEQPKKKSPMRYSLKRHRSHMSSESIDEGKE